MTAALVFTLLALNTISLVFCFIKCTNLNSLLFYISPIIAFMCNYRTFAVDHIELSLIQLFKTE